MTTDYVEIPESGGGSSLTDIRTSSSSSTAITLDFATANVYTGSPTSDAEYTTPGAAPDHTDEWFIIKNRGSANIVLIDNSSDLYYSAISSDFVIYPGESYTIISDGTFWVII